MSNILTDQILEKMGAFEVRLWLFIAILFLRSIRWASRWVEMKTIREICELKFPLCGRLPAMKETIAGLRLRIGSRHETKYLQSLRA